MEGNCRIPVLVGCTASGKTGLLLDLGRRRELEVIMADSRQVYRGMDIGTAKPSAAETGLVPHHLIDCIDPGQEFSAGEFARRAQELIPMIRSSGRVPVVSGGTALYVMALIGSLDPMPGRCPGVREGLETIESEHPGSLYALLERLDPAIAEGISPSDMVRQIRSIEIYALTGRPPSSLRKGGDPGRRELFRIVGIRVPGDELRRRIEERTGEMLRNGLIEEVRSLMKAGWGRDSALGRTIGYAEVIDFLDRGEGTMDDLRESICVSTWRFARRQRNMFRRIPDITWLDSDPACVEECLFEEGGC